MSRTKKGCAFAPFFPALAGGAQPQVLDGGHPMGIHSFRAEICSSSIKEAHTHRERTRHGRSVLFRTVAFWFFPMFRRRVGAKVTLVDARQNANTRMKCAPGSSGAKHMSDKVPYPTNANFRTSIFLLSTKVYNARDMKPIGEDKRERKKLRSRSVWSSRYRC
jgi:hypothetical protein